MLRVIETFCSVQGEGPFAGRRAWFLRLAGCNFRCRGFGVEGLYAGRKTLGCDTQRATYGAAAAGEFSAAELIERMREQTALWGQGRAAVGGTAGAVGDGAARGAARPLVVITGGEPLLQQNDPEFAALIRGLAGYEIQFETNGTVALSERSQALLRGAHFAIGCKLAASGERDRFVPEAIESLIACGGKVFFKPVISAADCEEFFGENFAGTAGGDDEGGAAAAGGAAHIYKGNARANNGEELMISKNLEISQQISLALTPPDAPRFGSRPEELAATATLTTATLTTTDRTTTGGAKMADKSTAENPASLAKTCDKSADNLAALTPPDASRFASRPEELAATADSAAATDSTGLAKTADKSPATTATAPTTTDRTATTAAATPTTADRTATATATATAPGAIAEILAIHARFPALRVFLMPQGATRAELAANAAAVAQAAIALGFDYSDRLHIRLWDDLEGV